MTGQSEPPPKPGPSPLPVRVLGWVTALGVVLVLPTLLLGKVGWLAMTLWGTSIIGLSLIGVLNLAGERDRWRAMWVFRRWEYARNPRGWPRIYPAFMGTTWYIAGGSFLMLLVGVMFAVFGLSEALR
jgi:hypothetical protein